MSILANMENAASILKDAEKQIAKIKQDSRAAVNPRDFINENTKKITAALRKDLVVNATARKKILLENCGKAQAKLETYMKPKRTGLENLHFMTAERITRAQSLEEATASYRRQVSRLSENERKDLRYIYDNALYETIATVAPEAEHFADQAIDEFRDDNENYYREGVKLEFEMLEQLKDINGLIESQADALEAGEEHVKYNWAQVLLEATGNAQRNVRGPAPMPGLKINPYDEEGEAEAAADEELA